MSCRLLSTGKEAGGRGGEIFKASYPLARAAYLISCGWSWKLSLDAAQSLLAGGGGVGGGGVDEMQNKAEAQPAWLQLPAGAAAGPELSLATKFH